MFNKKEKKPNETIFNSINISIFAMTIGVFIAGIGDLKFDLNSYLYCGFSVIFQALYLSIITFLFLFVFNIRKANYNFYKVSFKNVAKKKRKIQLKPCILAIYLQCHFYSFSS